MNPTHPSGAAEGHRPRGETHPAPQRMEGGRRVNRRSPAAHTTLTIVTVVFNGMRQLAASIDSVVALQREDIDYIVIDGGSSDGTRTLLQAHDSQLAYWLSEPDRGIYNAMNKAVALASTGSYLLFLGAGDRVLKLPDAPTLERAKRDGTELLYGDVFIGDSLFASSFNGKLRYRNTLHHQGMLLLKGASDAPWFDERLKVFADWDLNLSLYQRGVAAQGLGYAVAYAEPDGVSARLHLSEIMRMINRRCGPLRALAAAAYHGGLHVYRHAGLPGRPR